MSSIVTTSLVVSLGDADSSSVLTAEVDGRALGLNSGKTSFVAGDSVGYLIYKTDDVVLLDHLATVGSITPVGHTDILVEEFITFSNSREATLPKPVSYGWETPVWYGNDLGSVTVINQSTVVASKTPAPAYYLGVAKVKYYTRALQFRLATPSLVNGESVYDVLVFVAGRVGS